MSHNLTMAPPLHRYWIRLASHEHNRSRLGWGVTAFDVADALNILTYMAFGQAPLPPVEEVITDVDVRDLDGGHVQPNMNPPNWRGIWYPKGFDSGPAVSWPI
jgi:hypothetical protein